MNSAIRNIAPPHILTASYNKSAQFHYIARTDGVSRHVLLTIQRRAFVCSAPAMLRALLCFITGTSEGRERERTMHTSSPAPWGCHRVTLCFQTRQEPFTAAPPAAHGGVLSPQSANPERLPRRLQSSAATSKTTQSTPAKSKKQLPPRRS